MNNDLHERAIHYRACMSLAREMLGKGVIDRDDYERLSALFAVESGLKISTVFAENDLIISADHGNMSHKKEAKK